MLFKCVYQFLSITLGKNSEITAENDWDSVAEIIFTNDFCFYLCLLKDQEFVEQEVVDQTGTLGQFNQEAVPQGMALAKLKLMILLKDCLASSMGLIA